MDLLPFRLAKMFEMFKNSKSRRENPECNNFKSLKALSIIFFLFNHNIRLNVFHCLTARNSHHWLHSTFSIA